MDNSNLHFYTNPQSRGRIVRWMLEELRVPYTTTVLDFATTMKDPEYLAINPMGKVPTITHGNTVITETAAICAYLADAFPDAGLAPAPGSRQRGPYYRWLFFAAGPLEAATSNHALGFVVPQGREVMMGYGTYELTLEVVESTIKQTEYIAGDNFTAADVYLGSHIGFGMLFGTIPKRPAFERYWSKISARPAAIRARQIDDELTSNKTR
jgi:glutathione S-transferase